MTCTSGLLANLTAHRLRTTFKIAMSVELSCPDCAGRLVLTDIPKEWNSQHSKVYLCENWPSCKGLMSADEFGNPLGTPADAETRKARSKLHAIFDPLWTSAQDLYDTDCPVSIKDLRRIARRRAYIWLAHMLGIKEKDCHFAKMDMEMLNMAYAVIRDHRPTAKSIRDWYKS